MAVLTQALRFGRSLFGGLPRAPQPIRDARRPFATQRTTDVERYYEEMTPAYLSGFGEVFQGSRPESTEELLGYIAEAADLREGMRVLDAGCGVCGPATWFARHRGAEVEGLTVSPLQVVEATRRIAEEGLSGSVTVRAGDFHALDRLYPKDSFDRVLFLESLCHAEDYRRVLEGARAVLKAGGALYIKDFYAVDYRAWPERLAAQAADLHRLNSLYRLAVPDLASLVDLVGELGLTILYMRSPAFEPTYRQWAEYERHAGRSWNPQSGAPGEVIQGIELFCRRA